jgi:CHAT domain-containing protein
MKRQRQLCQCGMALLIVWSLNTQASSPLPLANLAAESPALRAALTGLLDDYVNRLPASYSMDNRLDQELVAHPWSASRSALQAICGADSDGCARVLPRQLDLLWDVWSARRQDASLSVQDGVTVSAMVDLCVIVGITGIEGRCLPRKLQSMAALAANIWDALGYQHLFLLFHGIEVTQQQTLYRWAKDRSLSASERAEALEQLSPNVAAMARDALAHELYGRIGDSLLTWSAILVQLQLADTKHAAQLTAMTNMARLAVQQGHFERARQWQEAEQGLLAGHGELTQSVACIVLEQQFDIDIEQAMRASALFQGQRSVAQLIDQDCSFTSRALKFALGVLADGRTHEAQSVLADAATACARTQQCGYSRKQQIGQLQDVARADGAALRKVALWWTARLATQKAILPIEIEMAWALAERSRLSGADAEALALYQQLDRHIDTLRGARYSSANLERYDQLTRMHARLEVVSGGAVALKKTESLRGQKLLRHLEFVRWTKQLADVSDDAALTELNEQLALGTMLRQTLALLEPGQHPFLRATTELMLEDQREHEIDFRETYLARLANKQSGMQDLSSIGVLMPLNHFEKVDYSSYGVDDGALGEDEAYLSWLRVPGGFIATLLARPSGRHGLVMAHHPLNQVQRFIAFSEQDEALLALYRQMLQDGAGVSRAARANEPSYRDKDGLMLGKLPLWQLPDGSLQGAPTAPVGGRRVTELCTLSDLLYQRLLAPFAPLYQEAQRLIVSADGVLLYLPFETLSHHGVSVLEGIDITYVQSLLVYGELKKRFAARRRSGPATLLSVADPVYSGIAAPNAAEPIAAIAWRPLPGTRAESDSIAALFRHPLQLLGSTAIKSVLESMEKKKELRSFQFLHFATHGYVDDERSALVLGPGPTAISAFLSDQEIVQWELESDLVLLSACNTGIGRRQQGEGVVGLPYAFFMAGNLNTLMSLWPVDDAGTAKLIAAFMQRVQHGEDHVTALNNTKRAFARGEHGEVWRNPRIWSAFILYGMAIEAPGAASVAQ